MNKSDTTDAMVIEAMDPNGATLKLREIEAGVEDAGGNRYHTQMVLRRMARADRVEFVRGPGGGWRIKKGGAG